jgi:hypothetical protein
MSAEKITEQYMVDAALLMVALSVALGTIWLQWMHFKRNYPLGNNPSAGEISAHRRWRTLYWREVRATFFLALVSLLMVAATLYFHRTVNLIAFTSVIFWLAMFFYNLWVAQWLAWRIATKRRR